MRTRTLLALASLVALLLPSLASASCAEFPPIGEHLAPADVVFTGTVIGLRNQDRTATFAVTEIWRGPDLLPEVLVHGGPDDPNALSSVDRMFQLETDYLVAARVVNGELVDDACSATRPYDETLAEFRPADARPPSPVSTEDGEGGFPILPIALGALFIVLVAGSGVAFRTRG